MALQPFANFRMLLGTVIAQDNMVRFPDGNIAANLMKGADELLMPVPLRVLADQRASQNIQRRKERGRSVQLIVVHQGRLGSPKPETGATAANGGQVRLAGIAILPALHALKWSYLDVLHAQPRGAFSAQMVARRFLLFSLVLLLNPPECP